MYQLTNKICVVIPAYNASATIGAVVRGTLEHLPLVYVVIVLLAPERKILD